MAVITKVELQHRVNELDNDLREEQRLYRKLQQRKEEEMRRAERAERKVKELEQHATNLAVAAAYWRGRAGEVPPEFDALGLLDVALPAAAQKQGTPE